jgi:hypothetical protein
MPPSQRPAAEASSESPKPTRRVFRPVMNGSSMFLAFSAGMPLPLSSTEKIRRSSALDSCTRMSRKSAPALMPFSTISRM